MQAESDHHATYHPRVEDDALVRGRGRYIADAPLPNQVFAYFVRSPHAFARIARIDIEAARAAPGVVGVLTGKDMEGVGSVGRQPPVVGRGGKKLVMPIRPALAGERVMHIGEPVAMVVAETRARGAGRRRAGHRRIRGADAGHRRPRRHCRRRPAIVAAGARQHRARLAGPRGRSRRQCRARSTRFSRRPSTSRAST